MDWGVKVLHSRRRFWFPFLALICLVILASFTMPVSNTLWSEKVMLGGEITTGKQEAVEKAMPEPKATEGAPLEETLEATATPTIQITETPLPTETLEPVLVTSIGISIQAAGYYDHLGATYGVSGEVCIQNTGANPTTSLSPIWIWVAATGSNIPPNMIEGSKLSIATGDPLGPGEIRCFPFQAAFTPETGLEYKVVGTVSIENHAGWVYGDVNCLTGTVCPYGPVAEYIFMLPQVFNRVDEEPTATLTPIEEVIETPTEPTTEVFEPTSEPTQIPTLLPDPVQDEERLPEATSTEEVNIPAPGVSETPSPNDESG